MAQMMRRYHTGQLVQIDINACGLCVGGLVCWGCLFDTEAVSAVLGDGEPSRRGGFEALFAAAMAAIPEAVEAIGLLATFGHETGINYQGLFMLRRYYLSDRRFVERDKVKVSGVPTGKGSLVIRAVAAQIPKRSMTGEHKQKSQQMRNKLLLRFLGLA